MDITEHRQTEEALRRSEAKYRRLHETMMDAFISVDMVGCIQETNRAYRAMLDYSEDELHKLTYISLTPQKWHAFEKRIVQEQILVDGYSKVYEKEYRKKDGTVFPVELRTFLMRDDAGNPVGMWAIVRDITERKQAEEALRESAEQYHNITSTSMDGFARLDAAGHIMDVNEAYCRMIGYSREELLNLTVSDIEAMATPEEIQAQHQKTRAGSQLFKSRHRCKDGHVIDVEVSMTVDRSDQVLVFIRDITERNRAEEALRESEKKYRSVIENIQDVFYRSDRNGRLLMTSPSGAETFGYDTIDEIIGIPLDSFWPDPRNRERILAQIKATGVVKDFEAMLKKKDGTTFNASLTTHFYYDDKGNVLGTEGIIRDISKRKRAEEERSKLEARMREVQKLESLGMLAGGVAHDFNNLLMTILGNADLALHFLSPTSSVRQNIEAIIKTSQQAADLCRQMLAYSGKGRYVLSQYDLSEIVKEIAHMLQSSVSNKATLRYRLAEDLPAVEADVTQLQQILTNLISNASEALGNESGVIEVSSGVMECDGTYLSESYLDDKLPEGKYIYLEVSDTGCGMDAETLKKIFDPFFSTKFTGRGLGLAAVLGIVRGHKGAIKVYSEPGKGTTIKILLPAVEWTLDERAQTAEPSTPLPGRGTILLVDDNQNVLDVASSMLEHLGFEVLAASDGQEGLEIFGEQAEEIDCVLLDLTMPGLSGEEVFQKMRRIRKDVRVILSSGYSEQEVAQRFTGKGLTGFIQKPYTLAKLREIIESVLG